MDAHNGHVVVVRFYFQFSPLPEITHLRDEEVNPAIEKRADQWWAIAKNRREYRRRQEERQKRVDEWNAGGVGRPNPPKSDGWFGSPLFRELLKQAEDAVGKAEMTGDPFPNRPPSNTTWDPVHGFHNPKDVDPKKRGPTLQEICLAAGWGDPENISKRYPVARFSCKDAAETACSAFYIRIEELRRSALDRELGERPSDDLWRFFIDANPRFVAIQEAALTDAEKITIREQLQRLSLPKGPTCSREEAYLRTYLPEIRGVLAQCEAIDEKVGHDDGGRPEPRVILGDPGDQPTVNGIRKDLLTKAQYDVVKALLEAGEQGLTKDELDRKSGHGDARKILQRLANKDEDWESVIHFPGTTGRRYRIF